MKASEVLEAVAELLSPEGRWTQRVFARNCVGLPINPESPSATCWCLQGAIQRIAGENGSIGTLTTIAYAVSAQIPTKEASISVWNDRHDRTQQQVVTVAKLAAARARTREAAIDNANRTA